MIDDNFRKNNLQCGESFQVYKFMPEKGAYSACCMADEYSFDDKQFSELGKNYFLLDQRLIDRKNNLLNNIKCPDCQQCWWAEDKGLVSHRLHYKKFYEHSSWDFIYDKAQLNNTRLGRIELWLGSICNMGCFMCHVDYSTILQKLYPEQHKNRIRDLKNQNYGEINKKNFLNHMYEFCHDNIANTSAEQLTIAYLGGEPTLMQQTFTDPAKFIKSSQRNKNGTRYQIELTSNGAAPEALMLKVFNMYDTYLQADWRAKFKFSLDAVGTQSQIRWGSNMDRIKANFLSILNKPSISLETGSLMSNLSLPYIDKLAEFFLDAFKDYTAPDNSRIYFDFNTIEHPTWMRIQALPLHLVEKPILRAIEIFEFISRTYGAQFEVTKIKNAFTVIKNCDPKLRNQCLVDFFDESQKIENTYSMKMIDYFPHVSQLNDYMRDHTQDYKEV